MNGYYDFDCGFANNAGRIGNQFGQVAYAPDGKLEFRANGASGKVVERRTGHPFGYELHCEAAIKEAFFSSDSSKLAIADSHAVTLVAAESGLPICDSIHGDAIIRTLRISQDASRILILREQGVVTLWDKQLGRHLDHKKTELGRLCQTETIQDITLSPSGEFVVAKCIGNPVAFVFSALDGRLIVQTDPQYGVPARVQFSGDGRRFLVGSSDSRARVWSLDSKSAVGPFLRHPTFVRFGCLSLDGTMAATFSADGKIRIWNSETGDLLHSMVPEVTGQPMWFSQDSLRLVITPNGGENVSLRIPQFNLKQQEVKRFVELITGQEIDNSEGIAELGATAFRNSPQVYMRAWRKSVGGRRE